MEYSTPEKVGSLFEPLDYKLAVSSVLAGLSFGDAYSNNLQKPTVAVLICNNHLFLTGSPHNGAFNHTLNILINETILPGMADAGRDVLILHTSSDEWHPQIDAILAGRYPVIRQCTYLESTELYQDWRPLLKPGFCLRPVDNELLAQSHLKNLDYLKSELCSERPTIDDFLEKSFGVCVVKEDQLAGWCLSEYNTGDRCEVGVATVDTFQRQGLGTVTTLALLEHAFSNGYRRIGWHCWTRNTASLALALRSGFKKVQDYSTYLCVENLGIQFALHGDSYRQVGAYHEAMNWYKRATIIETAPGWVFYNTARCLSRMGERKEAINHLQHAIQRGFNNFDQIQMEADLENLHTDPAWISLF